MVDCLSHVRLLPYRQFSMITNEKENMLNQNLFRTVNKDLVSFKQSISPPRLMFSFPNVILANKFSSNTINDYCGLNYGENSLRIDEIKRTQYVSFDYEDACQTSQVKSRATIAQRPKKKPSLLRKGKIFFIITTDILSYHFN